MRANAQSDLNLRWAHMSTDALSDVTAKFDDCAVDIFQKVVFCLALYTEEMYLQTFVMIQCKTICRNYLCTKSFILIIVF